MALDTALNIVKQKLPYMVAGDDPVINSELCQQAYFLQPLLPKEDADVELYDTLTSWKPLEKLLLIDLTCWYMLQQKVLANQAGVAGGAATGQSILKKAKADVVEAEFMPIKASDGTVVSLNTSELMSQLKTGICSKALTLKIHIPEFCAPKAQSPFPPVKVYTPG